MFAALALSLVFTFVYATAAAGQPRREGADPCWTSCNRSPSWVSVGHDHRVHRVISGSELGLECASIFAIFTSQAWNMTFAFYYSLISQPRELDEASRLLRLSAGSDLAR
jgi:NitT/TauT family transport system permease protein